MMSNGERRSARLVELESRAESKGTVICYAEEDVSSEEDDSCQKRRRKRVKSRPVQHLAASRNEHSLKTEEKQEFPGSTVAMLLIHAVRRELLLLWSFGMVVGGDAVVNWILGVICDLKLLESPSIVPISHGTENNIPLSFG